MKFKSSLFSAPSKFQKCKQISKKYVKTNKVSSAQQTIIRSIFKTYSRENYAFAKWQSEPPHD
jgi:hypothetical protein